MLFAVLFHWLLLSIKVKNEVDVYSDTIENIRDQECGRYANKKGGVLGTGSPKPKKGPF